jgi:putative spermidine/putrescine transport system substrate-binding protein
MARKYIVAALGAGMLAAPAAAQQELVINSFGGAYEKLHRELVIDAFEKQHNVKIKIETTYSADMLAKLRAQKANPQYDIAHFSGGLEAQAAAEGLLAPIKPAQLSNYSQMYPFAVEGIEKGRGPIYSIAVIGLVYNTEKVKPAPTSWNDLRKAEFKGRVLITDSPSNTYGMLGLLMMNKVAGGSLDNIQPGLDFVKAVLPGATVVSKSPEIQQQFAQGNAWIAAYAQDYAYTLTKAGLPVKFALPQEGAAFAPITINLVAGRKNTDLAIKFIDFSIRAEASKGWAMGLRYSPTNRTVQLPPDVAADVVYGAEAAAKLVSFDPIKIGQAKSNWDEAWKRAIAK